MFGIDDLANGAMGLIGKTIDKIFPDANQAAEAKLKMLEMQQAGEFKEIDAALEIARQQNDVNKAEAQSGNAYAAGWRPSAGYVCVAAMAYHFLLCPLLNGLLPAFGLTVNMPTVETGDLFYLLSGMLGLGGMRTFEKVKKA